ncbi:uncharacterized protein LOC123258876 [Cotesia glomerata]|uniref:uncharacterized protein LOC123258876 n=1 Tax=Cotesia glomerata TaxID=32391 RepID=UPI001D025C25|nr:uncharacterized protein LOC123258876 [Cotesia glomerata]
MTKTKMTLEQTRVLLTAKITALNDELTAKTTDIQTASLRFPKIEKMFDQYDASIDELEVNKPEDPEIELADGIRKIYYNLATKIKIPNQDVLNATIQTAINASTLNRTLETQRLTKLPTTDLPKFDGNFENWLSFKNTFKTLIDERKDLDDLNKFLYLRGCLTGSAANKLALLDASAENYTQARDLLTETYQKERALVFKHYDAFLNLNSISTPTNENLTKFIDDARQHLNDLKSLKANPTDAFIVRLLELKLPTEIRDKWDETYEDDNTLPTFDAFSKFIIKTAFRLSTRKPNKQRDSDGSFKRRRNEYSSNNFKKQKTDSPVRALVTTTSTACPCCKLSHPLYKCYKFDALTIGERIKFVKSAKLCNNCLREHKGTCPSSSRCQTCKKFHHTKLHIQQKTVQQPSNPNTSKNNAVKSESPITVTTDKGSTS